MPLNQGFVRWHRRIRGLLFSSSRHTRQIKGSGRTELADSISVVVRSRVICKARTGAMEHRQDRWPMKVGGRAYAAFMMPRIYSSRSLGDQHLDRLMGERKQMEV
jgi:hypothetical protein